MPRVRDLLYRFRPAGAPGAAGAAGVPADRRADRAAELEPLFARLADTERACDELRARAAGEVAGTRAARAEHARRIVAAAHERAEAERVAAATRARQAAEAESARELAAAEESARQLLTRGEQALPGYVEQVVGAVRALIGEADRQPSGSSSS